MTTVSAATILSGLQWRYATKQFDPARKISAETWKALEEVLTLSPSSYGLQLWKFVVVTTQSVKDQLPAHSYGQNQPRDASHLVVLAGRTEFTEADVDRLLARIVAVRGGTVADLAAYKGMMMGSVANPSMPVAEYVSRQVYIALGQLITSATLMGVDTCPMEGFIPAEYDQILGLTGTGYTAKVLCAAGYRSVDDKYAAAPKVRFPVSEVVHHI